MTTPTSPLLPEPLKVVAWLEPDCLPIPPTQSCLVSAGSGPAHWNRESLVRLTEAEAALNALRAEVAALRVDKDRMDWLMQHTVNVRVHLRYGSHNLFWAGPEEGDGEILPSDLRMRIDQAIATGKT